ncbi:tol-pal system protein YbgF [Pelovirga terrestris]|uniref:Tol-pal system protein YbgF n=1 Tax=Pelovirga terrestris TaxID=2771352 RepID=A0A8J6UNQ8_9BACT|nr:tol-pal system protein YbgF [Pelovirga terrestris]MBD1399914.1 tol-pal system protein YbgF [Pelovirga terrestris]
MRLALAIMLMVLIGGCIPPSQSQLRLEMDLEQMKRRLAQLEVQRADTAQTEVVDGTGLQRQVAELQAGLDNLRVESHSVNGLIDDLGRRQRDLADELRLVQDDLNLQIDSLTSRIEELETGSVTAGGQSPTPAPQPAVALPSPEQQYEQALQLIRDSIDFGRGREQMETFSRNYPDHDLHVNALYWTGEALYGEKKFELAILQFQDVISRYPRHSKAPDALYKQALAFNSLGDGQNARATMRKLIDSYPASDQARAAERFLQN